MSSATTPVSTEEQPRLSRSAFYWSIGAAFYFYQYLLRVSPSVIGDELILKFNIQASQLGMVNAWYSAGYAIMQIPIGIMLDRFGVRRLMPIAISLCGLGTLLFTMAPSWQFLLIARFMIGLGASGAFIGCMKIITMWFPTKLTPIFASFTVLTGSIGAIAGQRPVVELNNILGWNYVLWLFAIGGFGLAFLALTFLRDNKAMIKSAKDSPPLFDGLKQVVKNPQLLLIAAFAFLIYMPLSVIAEAWGAKFLKTVYNISQEEASLSNSFIFFGLAIGSPIFGYIASVTPNYRIIFRAISVAQLPVLALLIWFQLPSILTLKITLFILGILLGGQAIKFNAAFANASPEISGAIVGFVNACCMSSGFIFQQLVGFLLDAFWDGRLDATGAPLYSAETYAYALSTHLIALALCFFLTYFIKNRMNEDHHMGS